MPLKIESPSSGERTAGGADPKLTIRIIGRCNFRCPACSTFSGGERPGLLSLGEFARIIDLLREDNFHGTLHLSGGETTLHPDLAAMIALAARNLPAVRIAVFTNGDWVGLPGWRDRLKSLLGGPHVLVRFSLDRQHAEGKARAFLGRARKTDVDTSEKDLMAKARDFMTACLEEGAKPGANFDFAFKGTDPEAKEYLASLGDAPIYLIHFQKYPARRPKRMGFMAVDLDEDGRPRVYPTLGHIPSGEALGGIETLPSALRMNREAIHAVDLDERLP